MTALPAPELIDGDDGNNWFRPDAALQLYSGMGGRDRVVAEAPGHRAFNGGAGWDQLTYFSGDGVYVNLSDGQAGMRDDMVFPQPVPFPFPWNGLADALPEPVVEPDPDPVSLGVIGTDWFNIGIAVEPSSPWPSVTAADVDAPHYTTGTLFPTTGTFFPSTGGSFTAGSLEVTGTSVTGGSIINTGTLSPADPSGPYELGTYFQDWQDGSVTITSSNGTILAAEDFEILHHTVRFYDTGGLRAEVGTNEDVVDTLTNSPAPIDLIYGFETVRGGRGNDMLTSQDSGATLSGRKGHDALIGLDGRDKLFGGAGEDFIQDGGGWDQMTGGAGADLFVLDLDGSGDTIRDFESGVDMLNLTQWGVESFEDLAIRVNGKGDTVVRYEDERLILRGEVALTAEDLDLTAWFGL